MSSNVSIKNKKNRETEKYLYSRKKLLEIISAD